MIILKCNRELSRDQAERLRALWDRAVKTGKPAILGPGIDVVEINVPTMAGPLVGYLGQLGDA